jgi:hypothetical protein
VTGPARFQAMEYSTADLRNLMSVAKKLRHLAMDTPGTLDRQLYVSAADVLEKRAGWLATHLPEDGDAEDDSALHQPVDLLV